MPDTTTARTRHSVSPEIAANVREEDEALAATIAAAESVANAAADAARVAIEHAHEKRDAAMRPILRDLQIDGAKIVGTEGFGDATVLVVETIPSTVSEAVRV